VHANGTGVVRSSNPTWSSRQA